MKPDTTDEIDHLVNIEIGKRNNKSLYRAERKSKPLCLKAAEVLEKSISRDGTVFLTSGFPILPDEKQETDGPPGTIILARVLEKLDSDPVILSEKSYLDVYKALAEQVGLNHVVFETLPIDRDRAKEFCFSILDRYSPDVLISVEKPGMTSENLYYDMKGKDISDIVGKADFLFQKAEEKNIPTVGIGDGGNEIGMGNIMNAVKKSVKNGETIASETSVDSLMVSNVSNWGAYAITAALSILRENVLLHKSQLEKNLIQTCLEYGCVDGVDGKSKYSVDGIPGKIHENFVEILRYMVEERT